ncbi:MAG: lectin [Mycobacterium sp.]|nr:lectin [Mycobacterium sp.]
MGDTLTEGQKLEKGGSLTSNNGAYTLTLQDDANLVLAARGEAVWSTGTNRQDVQRAEVQSDGNFVLYTADKLLWHTGTQGKKEVKLVLQDDRNVVLYAATGPAWSTKTETDTAPSPAPDAAPEPVSEVAPAAVEEPVPPPAPEAEAPAPPLPPPPPAPRTYTVVSGDTLWAISERFYGDGSKYISGSPMPVASPTRTSSTRARL